MKPRLASGELLVRTSEIKLAGFPFEPRPYIILHIPGHFGPSDLTGQKRCKSPKMTSSIQNVGGSTILAYWLTLCTFRIINLSTIFFVYIRFVQSLDVISKRQLKQSRNLNQYSEHSSKSFLPWLLSLKSTQSLQVGPEALELPLWPSSPKEARKEYVFNLSLVHWLTDASQGGYNLCRQR